MSREAQEKADQLQNILLQSEQKSEALDSTIEQLPAQDETIQGAIFAAGWLKSHRSALEMRPGVLAAGWRRVIDRQDPLSQDRTVRHSGTNSLRFLNRPAFHLLLAFLLFSTGFLTANSLANANRTWIPGDFFYPLKIAQEQIALMLSFEPARNADLHMEFSHRRILELQALVFEGRYEQLPATASSFTSHLEQALWELYAAADEDPQRASLLAGQLQSELIQQEELAQLFIDISAEPARVEFVKILQVSRTGLFALRGLPNPNGKPGIQG